MTPATAELITHTGESLTRERTDADNRRPVQLHTGARQISVVIILLTLLVQKQHTSLQSVAKCEDVIHTCFVAVSVAGRRGRSGQ